MRRKRLFHSIVLSLIASAISGCPENIETLDCEVGEQDACTCDGALGIRTCAPDNQWGACACEAGPGDVGSDLSSAADRRFDSVPDLGNDAVRQDTSDTSSEDLPVSVDTAGSDDAATDAGDLADALADDLAAVDMGDEPDADSSDTNGQTDSNPNDTGDADDTADMTMPGLVAIIATDRLAGVAPLAVWFDGSESRDDGLGTGFHRFAFQWSFGEPGGGVWEATGAPRNNAVGPLAGHVFEEPGEFTVRLRVTDNEGRVAENSVTISVADPDTVFLGVSTILVSNSAGCGLPTAGRLCVSESTDLIALFEEHLAPNRRFLFQRGGVWTYGGSLVLAGDGPLLFGAYGEGDAPIWRATGASPILLGDASAEGDSLSDARFVDLHLDVVPEGEDTYVNIPGFRVHGVVEQLTFLGLTFADTFAKNFESSLHDLSSTLAVGGSAALPDSTAIVNCTLTAAYNPIRWDGERTLVLGNNSSAPTQFGVIDFVSFLLSETVVSNNRFHGPYTDLVAPDWDEAGLGFHRATERLVITANHFDGGILKVTQYGEGDYRARDVIIDSNFFFGAIDSATNTQISASNLTMRNNIFNGSRPDAAYACMEITAHAAEPAPTGVWLYNNTCYSADASQIINAVIGDTVQAARVDNNLLVGDLDGTLIEDWSGMVEGTNLVSNTSSFARLMPMVPVDFKLRPFPEGFAVDAGVPIIGALLDFAGNPRPVLGNAEGEPAWDVGAFEYQPE